MKITLDHNCLIDLERSAQRGQIIRSLIENHDHQCFIVNIGASELLKLGVRPDHYSTFENLLISLKIDYLARLDPIGIYGATFYGRCLYSSPEAELLLEKIEEILFGKRIPFEEDQNKWLNQTCDIHTLWSHIHYGNELFLTSDKNFLKSKKKSLEELGAGKICNPEEFHQVAF